MLLACSLNWLSSLALSSLDVDMQDSPSLLMIHVRLLVALLACLNGLPIAAGGVSSFRLRCRCRKTRGSGALRLGISPFRALACAAAAILPPSCRRPAAVLPPSCQPHPHRRQSIAAPIIILLHGSSARRDVAMGSFAPPTRRTIPSAAVVERRSTICRDHSGFSHFNPSFYYPSFLLPDSFRHFRF
ncbi:hypothetical protein QBC46DRAFT_51538 [Diplogelasinospora grovesii]|uniref:Uncharacterized protein n=1 Tax=Diplogelasinospora grovesii TaxID=303347 RepID=A0AAN6RZX2_9PEZI|nr:hypothetical protein QBC46DRAFT_51538 [Diplogelasinospora grovesii]